MASATMSFKRKGNDLVWSKGENVLVTMQKSLPLSTAYVVDVPLIKESIKAYAKRGLGDGRFATIAVGSSGVFWKAFLVYIFPWMLDIAKVYCAIKICQAFYEEKRGGREGGTGFGALVQYGKWYLVFWLIPWGVELIDQLGGQMFNDLKTKGLDLDNPTFSPYKK